MAPTDSHGFASDSHFFAGDSQSASHYSFAHFRIFASLTGR